MADIGGQGSEESDDGQPVVTEPITLTDPDGSVTRVAPWSTWTREQVRAPGGEPALVTRLDQGQLWFASGRRRSPWRHEVQVGPATVSTPKGRFHVTAEADGGATIACLAGRTRVVAGLREPVVLGPDQTAAVSSDGATLVVMDRSVPEGIEEAGGGTPGLVAGPAAWPADELAEATVAGHEVAEVATDEQEERAMTVDEPEHTDEADEDASIEPAPLAASAGDPGGADPYPRAADRHQPRWTRIPRLVAIAALLGVLVAAVVVFGGGSDDTVVADGRGPTGGVATSTTARPSTTTGPTTTAAPTTTIAPTTTVAPTTTIAPTTTPPALVAPGTAVGTLVGCRRAPNGVLATVTVTHVSGGPGRFVAKVGLVDRAGQVFASAEGTTAALAPGDRAPIEILVAVAGEVRGACELIEVVAA